jgi:hypothetical protein
LSLETEALRYPAAAIFAFTPIFLANLIFSQTFAGVQRPDTVFAWNLIGIMLGAMLEYAALITGYRALLLVVMAGYAAAFLRARKITPRAGG